MPRPRWRLLCLVKAVAEEGGKERVPQGTCSGQALLAAKPGLEAGCHVSGMGRGAAGPGPASSALDSCQRNACAETSATLLHHTEWHFI